MRYLYNLFKSVKIAKALYWCIIIFLGLYVFCIPSFGESMSFSRYFIYISMFFLGFFVFLYCLLFGRFKLPKTVLLIPIFIIISLIGTIAYSKDYRSWFTLVLLGISFFIFIYAFKIIKNKFVILNVIAAGLFLFSLYFIIYFRHEIINYNSGTRLGPPFDNQNGVAAYAVVGFAISLYLLLFYKKKISFIYILPTLSSLLVGVLTGSRTFLAIVPLFLLILLFFRLRKHKIIFLVTIISLTVFIIILLNMPFMEGVKDRIIVAFKTLFGTAEKADTATIERAVYVDYGFFLGSKNLFIGYGVNGFALYSGVGTYAHSNFAEVLCDFGLFGFLLFYLPLLLILLKSLTNKKIDKAFIISFVAYYVVVSFSNVLYYKKIYYLILALLYYFAYFEPTEICKNYSGKMLDRILIVCDTMGSGGAEKVIACLSNEFSNSDISVKIIGVADYKKSESFYKLSSNVIYEPLSSKNKQRINYIKRIILLRRSIKKYKPNAIISFLPNANIYAWLSSLGLNIPHIVSERNNPYLDPKGKVIKLLKILAFEFSDGAVFQTHDAMNYYSNRVISKSCIISNPIDTGSISNQIIKKRKNVVLSVGRLTQQKNIKCLLDAFYIFNKELNFSYLLRIYGDGPLKEELMNYCSKLGVSKYVEFMGKNLDWMSKEYDDSMFVLSSDYEGSPNALAEAMAIGIPSISTDCPTGGPRKLIQDGVNGYLIPTNNPSIMAQKMVLLSKQDQNIFFDATRKMIDEYSIEKISKEWIDFVKKIPNEWI